MTLRTPATYRRYVLHVSSEIAQPLAVIGLMIFLAKAAVHIFEQGGVVELVAR